MRLHFISRLALLLMAGFGVVASQAWTSDTTLQWIFFGGGVLMILIAAADAMAPSMAQRALDLLIMALGTWTLIEGLILNGGDLKWWSFGCACALAGLATIGLLIHEMTTERVVHKLEVIAHETPRERSIAGL